MIELINIHLSFGTRTILESVNWQVPDGSRVALVGANGTGKSTLLRIMSGQMDSDKGEVRYPKTMTLGYLPQDLVELEPIPMIEFLRIKSGLVGLEIQMEQSHHQMSEFPMESQEYRDAANVYTEALKHFEHIGGYAYDSRAGRILSGLGFKEKDFSKLCTDFSGGWKMRIMLAHILLTEPDIMLLDEPTNHLDTDSMEWLEDFLTAYSGSIIAVSHDRRFLDKMMKSTAELSRGQLTIYPGNYSYYLEQKEMRQMQLEAEKRKQDEYIERTTKFIERFRYKATKAAQAQSRLKQLEKIERIEIQSNEKHVRINFPEPPKCSYEVLKATNLSHGYDGISVLENLNFNVPQGEKLALVGVNGAGKSTLSRLLSKQETPLSGKVDWGRGVSLGFFAQESRMNVDYSKTIWEEISSIETDASEQQLRNLLGAFLFSGDDWSKPIEVLSGGEKSRLALCKLLLEKHNLLILDEPTNHLDITTRELFQQALMSYKGTLVLVSHDRYFLDQLISRVIEIRDHQAHYYMGNYSYFLAKRAELLAAAQANPAPSAPVNANSDSDSEPKLSPREQEKVRKRMEAERRRILGEFKKKIIQIEKDIHAAETEKSLLEHDLCSSSAYANASKAKKMTIRRKELEHLINKLYKSWQEYHDALESKSIELDGQL